jgi:hypothetical protein
MTATEPPAEPNRRPVSEIIESLLASADELARQHEPDRGDGPDGQAYYVLEVRGVPQAVSGPYGQAEPEASDLGRFEPTPYDLGITDNPEATRADLEPSFIGGLPEDRITVTAEREIAATAPEAEAEYEAEWADEWDSADSHAYMDRVEAGLEPEPEAEP